jgi:GT2 family glycosyltransferase
MRICLYIPCYNGASTLPEVLEGVSGQHRAPEALLLVNDRSDDDSAAIAARAGWTVVATASGHHGLSAARNVAVDFATKGGFDIVAGLDADAVPMPDYVATLADVFATRPEIAGVCGHMRERHVDTPSDLWRSIYMRQHYGDAPVDNPPILYGSSAAHRVTELVRCGGFNEALTTNFEDTDLTQRMLKKGCRLAYVPSLRSEHLKRDTPDSVLRMFWNWYRPPAELAGSFRDVPTWLSQRHGWIWADYRWRSRADAQRPALTALTMALPWVQVVRDLGLIAGRAGIGVDLGAIADLAFTIHGADGCGEMVARWICGRIEAASATTCQNSPQPLHPEILTAVREGALASFPRRTFWHDLQTSWHALNQG